MSAILLQENGDALLQESGGSIWLESITAAFAVDVRVYAIVLVDIHVSERVTFDANVS